MNPDPEKIKSVIDYPTPRTVKQVHSFLGLTGYYRRFISNYAQIAEHLTRLLRKDSKFVWDAHCEDAFSTLKEKLTSPPILKFPDFSRPFILTTDASNYAIGAVLSQKQDDESNIDLPIAYASRSLNKAERNYPTIERELLAIKWGIERFHPYLFLKKFFIKTDHRPLTYLTKNPKPSSRLLNWRLEIDNYDFEIQYKPGKSIGNADALSRIGNEIPNICDSSDILAVTRSKTKNQNIPSLNHSQIPNRQSLVTNSSQNI